MAAQQYLWTADHPRVAEDAYRPIRRDFIVVDLCANLSGEGVVIEVDCAPLLQAGGAPLLAVVGETTVAGKLPIRPERFGHPEIKNVIMSMKQFDQVNRDLEIRDLYNTIDRVDGKTDWPLGPDGSHPLIDLLLADCLVVDVSKPFSETSCFEIERASFQGRRWPRWSPRSSSHRPEPPRGGQ